MTHALLRISQYSSRRIHPLPCALALKNRDFFDTISHTRITAYFWTGILGIGTISALALVIGRTIRNQTRVATKSFFSLATPLAVKGTFGDFKMGIQTGGLIGTTIRLITSPFVVPLARILSKGLPEDGRDVCRMTIGSDNRPVEPLPGCVLLRTK